MTQLTYELICRYPNATKIVTTAGLFADIIYATRSGQAYIANKEKTERIISISDCQLILRTFEDVADEEMEKLKRIIFPNAKPNSEKAAAMVNELIRTDRLVNRDNIDYLRSISISTEPAETEGTYWVRANTIN